MVYVSPTRGQLEEIQSGVRFLAAYKTKTFSDTAGNGALNDTIPLFKVTGNCLVSLRGYCETTLTGITATLVHGKPGATNDLIPILICTNIVAGTGIDSTAAVVARGTVLVKLPLRTYFDNTTISATNATAAITAGKIHYICDYVPLTESSGVEAL